MRIIIVFLFLMSISFNSYATSWLAVEPEEVMERADVIVLGTYDFSGKEQKGEINFYGYPFLVEKVYKGENTDRLVAGIDLFDTGWAKEFQDKGGKFLLFLETGQQGNFPVPVAGPNGMVQIVNGKVQDRDEKRRKFYEEYLQKKAEEPTESKGTIPVIIGTGVVIGLIIGIIIFRYIRKK